MLNTGGRQRRRLRLRDFLRAHLAGSSLHAVGRVADSDRSPARRALWSLLLAGAAAGLAFTIAPLAVRFSAGHFSETRLPEGADFEFPDVYLCPDYPYSGSIPYTLGRAEANQLNAEIDRAGAILDAWEAVAAATGTLDPKLWERQAQAVRVALTRATVRLDLLNRHLLQTPAQSVPLSWLSVSDGGNDDGDGDGDKGDNDGINLPLRVDSFATSLNQKICFKPNLAPASRLTSQRQPGLRLRLVLLTDPYFADFMYSGTPVKYIRRPGVAQALSRPLEERERQFLRSNAFTLVLVPPGAYPSIEYEETMQLSPGNHYRVDLHMQRRLLAPPYCQADWLAPDARRDPVSGEARHYRRSQAACLDHRAADSAVRRRGCQAPNLPLLWRHRHLPRCGNLSEMPPAEAYKDFLRRRSNRANLSLAAELLRERGEALAACRLEQPCDSVKYRVQYSFGKWPSVATSAVVHFANWRRQRAGEDGGPANSSREVTPALDQLQALARRIDSVYHSAHDEAVFRAYTRDSLIMLDIGAACTDSERVSVDCDYPAASFLADLGGLLGLWLGCSLLTVFEAVDLLLALCAVGRPARWSEQPAAAPAAAPVKTGADTAGSSAGAIVGLGAAAASARGNLPRPGERRWTRQNHGSGR